MSEQLEFTEECRHPLAEHVVVGWATELDGSPNDEPFEYVLPTRDDALQRVQLLIDTSEKYGTRWVRVMCLHDKSEVCFRWER